MGVNMVGFCINDDDVCCEASKNEIVLRYFNALNRMAHGDGNESEVSKIALLFKQAKIDTSYRKPVVAARERAEQTQRPRVGHRTGRRHHHNRRFERPARPQRCAHPQCRKASCRH